MLHTCTQYTRKVPRALSPRYPRQGFPSGSSAGTDYTPSFGVSGGPADPGVVASRVWLDLVLMSDLYFGKDSCCARCDARGVSVCCGALGLKQVHYSPTVDRQVGDCSACLSSTPAAGAPERWRGTEHATPRMCVRNRLQRCSARVRTQPRPPSPSQPPRLGATGHTRQSYVLPSRVPWTRSRFAKETTSTGKR